MSGPPPPARGQHWRIDGAHGLHVVQGDRPVATFHDAADAATAVACVQRVNAVGVRDAASVVMRPQLALEDFPLVARGILAGQAHPYYGTNLDELFAEWSLVAANEVRAARARADLAQREAAEVSDDSSRVAAVRLVLREAGQRKNVERHAVEAALDAPQWRLENAAGGAR